MEMKLPVKCPRKRQLSVFKKFQSHFWVNIIPNVTVSGRGKMLWFVLKLKFSLQFNTILWTVISDCVPLPIHHFIPIWCWTCFNRRPQWNYWTIFFPAKFICTTHDKASYGHSNSVIKAVNNYFKSSFNKKIFYSVESNPYIMVYT